MWCLICEFSDQGDYCRESGVDVWVYGMATVTPHCPLVRVDGAELLQFGLFFMC